MAAEHKIKLIYTAKLQTSCAHQAESDYQLRRTLDEQKRLGVGLSHIAMTINLEITKRRVTIIRAVFYQCNRYREFRQRRQSLSCSK